MACQLRVGLTGGIGSGKSAASQRFEQLGATVIDTDVIARELVEPGQPALQAIVTAFGPDLIDASGRLDRAKLRAQVFRSPPQRKQLEAILHPRIRARCTALAEQADTPYCILIIPLLAESGADYRLDRILLIDAPQSLQRQRVAARDKLDGPTIDGIIDAQASREQRMAIADDVVVNDGSIEQLNEKIDRLHRQYLALAASRSQANR